MPNPCAPASALTRIATLLSSLITSLVFQAFRGAKRRGERVSMMVSGNEFHAANKRASTRMAKGVRVVSAKYDRRIGMVVVQLSSGLYLQFRPRDIQGMEHARPSDLDEIVISPSGLGLYVPALDADVLIPWLLRGVLGSRAWMKSLALRPAS